MTIPQIGTLATGLIVGYLVLFCVRRFKKFDAAVFAALLGAIFAGGAVTFLKGQGELVFYYPIGVVAGMVCYMVLAIILMLIAGGSDDGGGGGGGGSGGRPGRPGPVANAARALGGIFLSEFPPPEIANPGPAATRPAEF